ncbi:YbjN domain-containing protein [uncultured Jatrophihabitans sp.]|uniref:YbjN domain-containing protein n=1 Tax=uncultured Jatrophihabitans sp. TaxID=1610747 RepID=UPI0035CA2A0B
MFRRRPRADTDSMLTSRRHEPGGSTLVRPTVALIQQLLDEYGLLHTLDEDGDLLVRWEKCSIYFFFYGERREVLQARLYLHRRFDVESRTALALLLDEWNRTKLFPKAFTMLPDDGQVHICAEHCYDYENGATRAQLKYAVGVWVETLLRFADWVDDQL